MFKFFKKKLKSAISKLSKGVDKETEEIEEAPKEEIIEEPKEEIIEEKTEEVKEEIEEAEEKQEEQAEARKEQSSFVYQKPEVSVKPKVEEVEEKPEPAAVEKVEEKEKKKSFLGKIFGKKKEEKPEVKEEKKEVIKEDIKEEPEEKEETPAEKGEKAEPAKEQKKEEAKPEEKVEEVEESPKKKEPEEKKGIFGKIKESVTKKSISEEKFEKLFWELEVVLMENNVAVEVIEKIKNDLKQELVEQKVLRGKIEEIIKKTLTKSINEVLKSEGIDLLEMIKEKSEKPYVIAFVGINGTGKTTTIAKIAKLLQKNKLKPVIAASDTFRAAAIQQLEEHANKLDVRMIKHDYGSDPAAVAFDAVKYAKAKELDVVLIDTAGRMHSNVNLMDEMKKIIRVAKPDLKIFVGDSLTGNDCVEQSREFDKAVGIDAIILAKADVDEKGGAALSVSYVTKKPIMFLGVGQGYEDLETFDSAKIMQMLGLEA